MCKILDYIKPGVLNSKETQIIFSLAKKHKFAIPAINCISTDSMNSVLESAAKMQSPVIIQFSYGGASFISGLGLKNHKPHSNAIIGAISGAQHIHLLAKYYKIPVILHTDHCDIHNLEWIDGLIKEGSKFFKKNKRPLFSSHMIDLSKESIKKNTTISSQYLKKITKLNMFLEIELGCTGGEEDGVNNLNINKKLLYTDTKDIYYTFKKLIKISNNFIIAAAFGNTHGVYQPGNILLKPSILKKAQKYISKKKKLPHNPLNFVFHGGSGTNSSNIKKSINYGVVKFNIDTDIQWSYWKGVLDFYCKNKQYLHSQLGNSLEANQPNKKYYDPRVWLRSAQNNLTKYLEKMFKLLNSFEKL
ncbi:class II fructose-bisphosphate aldolase [Buchnera aphidicola]|uniref:Fructose-bisphosphate aldolase n=1 Tax=Buchnera aphidicola (Cinara cf. splendens/pseudotsugae 3390) TaxID=2518980 RepID=A0A451CXK5_9GAMM|nr:class II fructose-bisphosphate aldolase [Buchnera aphidicola]VFP77864.1 Fructose-bisphosphate aldolase class 2 [Buchnera aphidicola (Cinara cf. splendens/pseudotsugae 3390)]